MDFTDKDNTNKEVMAIFQAESEEIIERIFNNLFSLESTPANKELIGAVYRDLHSLKGAVRMVGFNNIQTIFHKMEDLFDAVNNDKFVLDIETIKLLSSGKGLGTFINEGGSEDESITLIAKEALEISKQAEEQVKNVQNKILEVENTLSSIEEDIKSVSSMATDYQEFKENNLAEIESINEKILLLQNQTNSINSDLQTINENISKLNEKNTEYDINISNLQKEISSYQIFLTIHY